MEFGPVIFGLLLVIQQPVAVGKHSAHRGVPGIGVQDGFKPPHDFGDVAARVPISVIEEIGEQIESKPDLFYFSIFLLNKGTLAQASPYITLRAIPVSFCVTSIKQDSGILKLLQPLIIIRSAIYFSSSIDKSASLIILLYTACSLPNTIFLVNG